MSSVGGLAALLLWFIFNLVVKPCTGQGIDCSCNVTNSRCDETGVCRCDPGWEGLQCERCVSMPGCVRGSCQQPWQCICEEGWGGRFCDKDLQVCSEQQPCLNGATCVTEESGDYSCVCPLGFYGRDCERKAGPCHQRRPPCRNGGQCEDSLGFSASLTCRCLSGFSGPRCETDTDDCLMSPCANGASCLDGLNRFSCVCPVGFTGRFCTVNVDDCASQPCANGARCVDRAGGFTCVCRPGYTGATCDAKLAGRTHLTTPGKEQRSTVTTNSSHHGDRLFKVTVSERSAAGLTELQVTILLVLASVTLAAVALTAALVLQRHCRCCSHAPCCGHAPCCRVMRSSMTSSASPRGQTGQSDEPECHISFMSVAEPEKKKLNSEVI